MGDEEMLTVCVHSDTTGLYSEDECGFDNLCDLAFPRWIVGKYYEQSKDVYDMETSKELGIPVEECTFNRWFSDVCVADDFDELFEFALEHGFEAKRDYWE